MTRALLQQALEALETCVTIKHGGGLGPEQLFNVPVIESACKAIRTHLAQPQGEPVAWLGAKAVYTSEEAASMCMDSSIPLFTHPAHTEQDVQEIMEFARHYAAGTFDPATLEDKIRRSLAVSATAPAWYDAQQAEIESLRWTVKDALESLDNGMTADCRATLSSATKETP